MWQFISFEIVIVDQGREFIDGMPIADINLFVGIILSKIALRNVDQQLMLYVSSAKYAWILLLLLTAFAIVNDTTQ